MTPSTSRTVRAAPPRPPTHLVPRPRLVDRIETGLADGALAVVHGPPGAGASTLAAEWAATTDRDVVWLRGSTTDPSRTFRDAVLSAVGLAPAGAGDTSADVAERLVRATDGRLVIVLDDAHGPDVAGFRAELADLLEVTQELHAVVVGRAGIDVAATVGGSPGDTEARLARLTTTVVGPEALALNTAETAMLLGRAVRAVVAPALVDGTVRSIAGHAGVLVAAANALADDDLGAPELGVRFRREVERTTRTWLARAIDDQALRDFVVGAAAVRCAPDRLARQLTGTDDLERAYREAAAAGLGQRVPDGFRWWPAIVAALRAEGMDDRAALLRDAAERGVAVGAPLAAVDAAVQLDDLDLLSTVLRSSWSWVTGPDAPVLAGLLAPIGPRRAAGYPFVLAAVARADAAAGRHHARATAALAAALLAVEEHLATAGPAETALLHAVAAEAHRSAGDGVAAGRAAAAARAAVDALDPADLEEIAPTLAYVHEQAALTALSDGDTETALADLARVAPEPGPDGTLQHERTVAAIALVHAVLGEVGTARRILDGAAGDGDGAALDVATGVLARAVVAVEDGALETALGLLDRVDPVFGSFEHWPVVLSLRLRVRTMLGVVPPADLLPTHDAEVERFRLRSPSTGLGTRMLARSRVRVLLAAGQLVQAERALGPVEPWNAAEHAGLRLARDEPTRALEVLDTVLAPLANAPRTSALLLLLRAVALARTGDPTALRTFRDAVDVLDRHGLRSELLVPPRADLDGLVDAASAAGDDRARRMLAELRALHSVLPAPEDAVVLTDREVVVLGLLATPGSLPEVAVALHVSVNTVKTQVRSIYRKFGVSERRAAVRRARELGFIAA